MARAIWEGEISFGLINIQVELFTAVSTNKVQFHLLDKRDGARIHYSRVNEKTGEEVDWDQITKGYEYEDDHFLLIEEDEIDNFKPELTKTIDLEEFINLSDISGVMYDKPYYLIPNERSEKPYVLLREAIKQQNKAGIGRVVIRAKQHLAMLYPIEDVLVLNLLFFPEEIKPLSEWTLPKSEDYEKKITGRELELTYELIESMSGTWDPTQYTDEYNQELRNWLDEAVKNPDKTKSKTQEKEPRTSRQVVDIEALLRKSLQKKNKSQRKIS